MNPGYAEADSQVVHGRHTVDAWNVAPWDTLTTVCDQRMRTRRVAGGDDFNKPTVVKGDDPFGTIREKSHRTVCAM